MTNKKVYGIASGYQGYGSGDIFEATAWKDSSKDNTEQAKDLEGNWVDVIGMFFITDESVPQMHGWTQFIPEEKE